MLVTESEIEAAMKFVLERHRLVIEGAAGVAVTGEILLARDPAAATAALRSALDGKG